MTENTAQPIVPLDTATGLLIDKRADKKKPDTVRDPELEMRREFLNRIAKPFQKNAANSRQRYDYEWMQRELFWRGYHFSKFQASTNTITLASRQSAKVPVNLVAAQMRSIRNQVTSFKPKFECLPRFSSEESKVQARYCGRLLDYFYEHLHFKKKIKETVTQGLICSIGGPWKIYYDEIKREVGVYLVDPWDFYFDPNAEEGEDCEGQVIATRRPYSEIVTNPQYSTAAKREISGGESRLAVSEYKQFMIQALRHVNQYDEDSNPGIILFSGDFKIRDPDTGKAFIRKLEWTEQNSLPLYWEDTDDDEYDQVIYHADLNPKEILGESWMKHTMPINRVIDALESSAFDYNHRIAKGRIVVDRDSGVRAIHNTHGEIISKNRGSEVRALDLPPLPVSVANQIERMQRYIEDIGGVHDATLGRVPVGVRTGVGIAELKQSDSSNQDDLVDNLEDFLAIVGRKVLKKVSKNYKNYQVIHALGYRENQEKYFAVVGKGSGKTGNKEHGGKVKIGPDWLDLSIIGGDNVVRVTIGSWLGYTKEMMEQKVMKYAQLGLIDQKTALTLLEFGNIDEIVQQTRIEMLLRKSLSQPTQPGMPEQDQYGLAMTENEMIVFENKPLLPQPTDDHIVHMALHQEMLGRGNDELLKQHMDSHQIYLENGPSTAQGMVGQAAVGQGQPGGAAPSVQLDPPAPQAPSPTLGGAANMSLPLPNEVTNPSRR